MIDNDIKACTLNFAAVGELIIEKTGAGLQLQYAGKQQNIDWSLPEPITDIKVYQSHIKFTYQFSDTAVLEKALYFEGGEFYFQTPDGICYFDHEYPEQLPFVYFKARDGSSITFHHESLHTSLTVEIHNSSFELNDEGEKSYFTEYRILKGKDDINVKLAAGEGVNIAGTWLYQSSKAKKWAIFLLSNEPLDAEKRLTLFP